MQISVLTAPESSKGQVGGKGSRPPVECGKHSHPGHRKFTAHTRRKDHTSFASTTPARRPSAPPELNKPAEY